MKYNIFISYRRTSSETANLIAVKLRERGYNVFFDVESLRGGKFNEQLYQVIDEAKDVVVVLPINALDRCSKEDDWVRKEVCHAIAKGKNIVPVMLSGFVWPDPMPTGMESLKDYQAVTATSHEYFDMAIDRMCKYLKSKPHKRIRKTMMVLVCAVAVLMALYFVADAVMKKISVPVCTEVADKITMKMGGVDMLASDNNDLKQYWFDYKTRKITAQEMLELLDFKERQLRDLVQQNKLYDISLSEYHKFLVMLHGIDGAELDVLNPYYEDYFLEHSANIAAIRQAVIIGDKSIPTEKTIDVNFDLFMHNVYAGYYAYLEFMSLLPKAAQKSYWQIGDKMENMPNGVGLNHTKEEFNQFVSREINECERLNQLLYKDVTDKEEELRLAEQKYEQMVIQVNAMYNQFKEQNRILPEDNQGVQVGKLSLYGSWLYTAVLDEREAKIDGFDCGPIDPVQVYNDIISCLDLHQQYCREAEGYVPALKLFYKDILDGKRECKGQLVVAFQDNQEHPYSIIGDIVIARNGVKITDFDSLKKAAAQDVNGTITYLRVVDGVLKEITEKVKESSVLVGYMNLTM